MEIKRGKIIVIEGTDCSGKETQTKMLCDRLISEGISCESISFPRYNTPTGQMVSRYLGKEPFEQEFGSSDSINPKLASVLYAEDRFFAKPEITSLINSGKNLIINRYVESNMGHQGGKIKDSVKRLEFFKWLDELEYKVFELPRPDAVIFLYMPHELGMKLKTGRPGKADGHESNKEHLKNAEESYLQLADLFGWKRVDCSILEEIKTKERIHQEVYDFVRTFL